MQDGILNDAELNAFQVLCFNAPSTRLPCLPACSRTCLQDGILNDAELNAFQVLCFNAPLQAEELVGVKQVVAERIEQVSRRMGAGCDEVAGGAGWGPSSFIAAGQPQH